MFCLQWFQMDLLVTCASVYWTLCLVLIFYFLHDFGLILLPWSLIMFHIYTYLLSYSVVSFIYTFHRSIDAMAKTNWRRQRRWRWWWSSCCAVSCLIGVLCVIVAGLLLTYDCETNTDSTQVACPPPSTLHPDSSRKSIQNTL